METQPKFMNTQKTSTQKMKEYPTSKPCDFLKLSQIMKKNEIIKNFDFEKASEVMSLLNWNWAIYGRVPNPLEIKKNAIELIDSLFENDNTVSVSSGGFTVRKSCEINDGEYDTVKLSFEALGAQAFLDE